MVSKIKAEQRIYFFSHSKETKDAFFASHGSLNLYLLFMSAFTQHLLLMIYLRAIIIL